MNDQEQKPPATVSEPDEKQSPKPRGYLVANYSIHDEGIYQQYVKAASALNVNFNAKAIIYDRGAKVVEGGMRKVIAIAEFPSLEAAEQFYYSAGYQEAVKLRLASTKGSVLLAESSLYN